MFFNASRSESDDSIIHYEMSLDFLVCLLVVVSEMRKAKNEKDGKALLEIRLLSLNFV